MGQQVLFDAEPKKCMICNYSVDNVTKLHKHSKNRSMNHEIFKYYHCKDCKRVMMEFIHDDDERRD